MPPEAASLTGRRPKKCFPDADMRLNSRYKEIKMIKTKSIYDPAEESDGERILVSRFWPRGISKERLSISQWIRYLAPSKTLVQDWKAGGMTWAEYESRYSEEMTAYQEDIETLAKMSDSKTITLLCYESEGDPHCHRHLLKRMIEKKSV